MLWVTQSTRNAGAEPQFKLEYSMSENKPKKRLVRTLVIGYLMAVFFFGWGVAASISDVFPHSIIKSVQDFVEGKDLGESTTLLQKMRNDLDVSPDRLMTTYNESALSGAKTLALPGIAERRLDQPGVFIHPEHAEGVRAVFGALDFEDSFWGGVLVGPDGDLLHTWRLSTDHLPGTSRPSRKNLYGVSLQPDGSVIFTMQERGGGIVRIDACSNVVWDLPGFFHHAIAPTERGTFWTFQGRQTDLDPVLAEVSISSGSIVRTIDIADVREANPHVTIFDLRSSLEDPDPTHPNDVDPLPTNLAPAFPSFSAGDLVLSYRSTNLIYVLDPESMEVKWWRVGPWDRQHDPDWEDDGRIYVYSNNGRGSPRDASDIVAIDPVTHETEVVVDGYEYDARSVVNGTHQKTTFDTRVISSTRQGWAYEVDANGKVVFSFVNVYRADDRKSLPVSDAFRFDESYFTSTFWGQCP